MPKGDINFSNGELALMIAALELAERIMPEADIDNPKILSENMAAVQALLCRLTRAASDRRFLTSSG
jgi:hypothetical protein